jgi:ribosomal protein S18 acetylase RimI-like enzyme
MIDTARPDELADALRLAFAHLPPTVGHRQAAEIEALLQRSEPDAVAVLVARDRGRILGVTLVQSLAGGSGLIWPPQGVAADDLIQAALARLRRRGCRIVQSLLGPEDAPLTAPLFRHGFINPTRLVYLQHVFGLSSPRLVDSPRLRYQPFDPAASSPFLNTLFETYRGTLDFPELNDRRTAAEVLAGYQCTGSDPEHWRLATLGEERAGILIVNPLPDANVWDLGYVGVVPTLRRRGLGEELVRKGMVDARIHGARGMTVAVDDRNLPAKNLYDRLGFRLHGHREVFLRLE